MSSAVRNLLNEERLLPPLAPYNACTLRECCQCSFNMAEHIWKSQDPMVNKEPERLHYMSSFYLPSDSSRFDDEESRNQRVYWRCIRYSQKRKEKKNQAGPCRTIRKESLRRSVELGNHTRPENQALRHPGWWYRTYHSSHIVAFPSSYRVGYRHVFELLLTALL